MDNEILLKYIKPELLILVVGLYFIGMLMKKSTRVKDEWIPFLLWGISTLLCFLYIFAVTDVSGGFQQVLLALFNVLIQGALCAAGAVFTDQLKKQYQKSKMLEEENNEE